MKYFVSITELPNADRANYVEFQLPCSTKDIWDDTSLYMTEETMTECGLEVFLNICVYCGILFDTDGFSCDELDIMHKEASETGGKIHEVVSELAEWVRAKLSDKSGDVTLIHEHDRIIYEGVKLRK